MNIPAGSTVIENGWGPVWKGEPVIGLRELFAVSILYPPMLLFPKFATYANRPDAIATATDWDPAANGEPGTGVKAEVAKGGPIRSTARSLAFSSGTKTR